MDTRENIIEECQRGVILAEALMQDETAYIMARGIAESSVKRISEIRENCQNAENIPMFDIEISEIVLLLKKFKYNQIGDELLAKLEQCRGYVHQTKVDIENTRFNLFDELEQVITDPRPGKVRKIVNENAEGDTFIAEVLMMKVGEAAFKRKCGDAQEQLKKRIEHLFCEENVNEKICKTAIIEQLDKKYIEYCSENRDYFRDCISDCLNGNEIWSRLQSYWGGGNGYSKEIAEEIKKELVRQSIESKLGQENYYMDYVNDIEVFLNISK